MIILIDSGILGILSNPNESEVNTKCFYIVIGLTIG